MNAFVAKTTRKLARICQHYGLVFAVLSSGPNNKVRSPNKCATAREHETVPTTHPVLQLLVWPRTNNPNMVVPLHILHIDLALHRCWGGSSLGALKVNPNSDQHDHHTDLVEEPSSTAKRMFLFLRRAGAVLFSCTICKFTCTNACPFQIKNQCSPDIRMCHLPWILEGMSLLHTKRACTDRHTHTTFLQINAQMGQICLFTLTSNLV